MNLPKQKLVIAEKPSVGMAIAKALGCQGKRNGYMIGCGYIVSWCTVTFDANGGTVATASNPNLFPMGDGFGLLVL